MRRSRSIVLAAALALVGSAALAEPGPLVLLVGDSTSQGVCIGCPTPPAASPAGALQMLRDRLPDGSPWRGLRAVSAGVGGSTSGDWVRVRPEVCRFVAPGIESSADLGMRAVKHACDRGVGIAAASLELLGERPQLVLLVLGANDVMSHVGVDEYLANLRALTAAFAPAPVLVATPFYSSQPERAGLADYAAAIRRSGLLRGPDFQRIALPLDASQVHLTQGGYAAAAALWLDELAVQPGPGATAGLRTGASAS